MANKKLIEVALPLEAINAASAREKSIRHGHPSTLHLWWARRPLAAARAVIWASLVDDPSSHPEQFPTEEEQNIERQRLFKILEDLVVWENSNNQEVLESAKAEIMKSNDNDPPVLLDPFAGGGSIPLEAQRLGLKTFAHDLNPVAVMINKAMIEIPRQFFGMPPINPDSCVNHTIDGWMGAQGLAEDVRYYGSMLRKEAKNRIGHLYPTVQIPENQGGGRATVIAWIWARTVKCQNPACGCQIPLIKSLYLTKKKGKEKYLRPVVSGKHVSFAIEDGKCNYSGTIGRKGGVCPKCNATISLEYVRDQGQKNELGAQMLAVVAEGNRARLYIAPDDEQILAAEVEKPAAYPDLEVAYYPGCTNCKIYGMENFSDIYTSRQLYAVNEFSNILPFIIESVRNDIERTDMPESMKIEYCNAIQTYLAFAIDRLATRSNRVCLWNTIGEKIEQPFGRQAIPMVWSYPEVNVFSKSSGGWESSLEWIPETLENLPIYGGEGSARQSDANTESYTSKYIVSTDPPYYNNVPYADLADFFYMWLRKNIGNLYPEIFSTVATPKETEIVAEKYRHGGDEEAKKFFESHMKVALKNIYPAIDDRFPFTIYYAYKQHEIEESDERVVAVSSGWETMLSALINAGFLICGTWPIRTERATGLKAALNALNTSILLVCRKRPQTALQITRRNFINELKRELRPALKKLQDSNIAPVDLVQSAIGPGMGIFSKYKQVLESDGFPMTVRSALQIINQELDLYFNEQDGEIDRDSRLCVELYTQYAFNDVKFGEADTLARAKNTSVDTLASNGVLYAQKGIVHLFGRDELPNKALNNNSIIWLLTQQLTRAMETGGIEACARIVAPMLGSNAEYAKSLAYRLYTIAERKGWAQEAYAYNSLVIAWSDIQSRAAQIQAYEPEQLDLFSMGFMNKGGE